MYSILQKDFTEVMESDYIFKSNAVRKSLEFDASEFSDVYFGNSTILIVYNPVDGLPLFLCERVLGDYNIDVNGITCDTNNFVPHVEHSMRGSGPVTDIVLTRRNLYDAIMEEQTP